MSDVLREAAQAEMDKHVATLRSFVSSVRSFHGECSVSCRPGCAMDVDAAEAAACLLTEFDRLRAALASADTTQTEVSEGDDRGR